MYTSVIHKTINIYAYSSNILKTVLTGKLLVVKIKNFLSRFIRTEKTVNSCNILIRFVIFEHEKIIRPKNTQLTQNI